MLFRRNYRAYKYIPWLNLKGQRPSSSFPTLSQIHVDVTSDSFPILSIAWIPVTYRQFYLEIIILKKQNHRFNGNKRRLHAHLGRNIHAPKHNTKFTGVNIPSKVAVHGSSRFPAGIKIAFPSSSFFRPEAFHFSLRPFLQYN